MRQRKSSSSPTHPVPSGAETSSERKLDAAYRSLGEALRMWRREPDVEERKQTLIKAIDARDDALARVVDEDVEREEKERAASVQG